jgi:hypothetical protein
VNFAINGRTVGGVCKTGAIASNVEAELLSTEESHVERSFELQELVEIT